MKNKMFESYINAANQFLKEDAIDDFLDSSDEADVPEIDDSELPDEDLDDEEEPEMIPCPDCDGEGVVVDEDGEEIDCETCGGEGEVPADEEEYDFDPAEGICPCCGAKLNCVGCDDEDLEDEELDDEDLDLEDDEDIDMPFDEDEE